MIERRQFTAGAVALVFGAPVEAGEARLFGLIGKMTAKAGQRDALIDLVLQGVATMPGCISYIVAKDAAAENDIWITEVWDSAASHAASLKLPAVVAAIGKAMPLIDLKAEGFRRKTVPVGGTGIG